MPTDKIPFTLRLPEDVLEELRIISKEEARSINNLIEYYIKLGIERYYSNQEPI